MVDGSWDNSGLPAPKKGLGTGTKVAIGCGVALLLAIGGCVAFLGAGVGIVGKQMQAREWPALRSLVAQLQTDPGALAVYEAHPRLAEEYPTADRFLEAVRAWRPRLEALPAQPPSVFGGRLDMNISVSNGRRSAELGYRNDKGATLRSRWEDGRLVALRVE